jgi:hypothetical protein
VIPAATVISAIGGVRATVWLSLAVLAAAAAGIQTVRLSSTQASYDGYKDKMIAATAKAAKAAAEARETSYVAREAYYWKSGEAENAYQAGRESAIQSENTLVADLRAERVRLRGEWSACMSKRVPAGSTPSGAPEGQDGPASVPAEAFGRVLRVGADADNLTRWLQSELIATRELYSKCMIPKSD